MSVADHIKSVTAKAIKALYQTEVQDKDILVNATKPEFEGDYTVVLFAFVKQLKKSPDALGHELGEYLLKENPVIFSSFNIIKGFLNLTIANTYWFGFLQQQYANKCYGMSAKKEEKVVVEYASPNTNKPLHLGHLRNIFLGWSIAEILKASGCEVVKTCIVNDRGIHICKSMIAWQLFANGATPQSTNTKGDHFVGDYYVKFNNVQKKHIRTIGLFAYRLYSLNKGPRKKADDLLFYSQLLLTANKYFFDSFNQIFKSRSYHSKYHFQNYTTHYSKLLDDNNITFELEKNSSILNFDKVLIEKAFKKKNTKNRLVILSNYFENDTPIMKQAQQMLIDWEAGKPDVIELWQKMNSWVYEGFDITYKKIGTDFHKVYYESNTYLLGKDMVEKGLAKGVFYQKEDSSVWIDLTNDGLDEKIVRRKDGTSVYITQDIGLAEQKQDEYQPQQSIYVVGDEQNYHFKVLKLICKKLEMPSADGIFHLSYGMVELPTGKMKSREGTVVDADDIVEEMISISRQKTEELGKVKDFSSEELTALYNTIGLGALKFFLLRVDPKKKMVFNPEESIDFHGFTGPFIQYTYARIKSILRKTGNSESMDGTVIQATSPLLTLEKELIVALEQFTAVINEAAAEHDPSKVAIYIFNLAKTFNSFYTEHSIANAESEEKKQLRLQLAQLTATVLATGMRLLGVAVPERM